MSAWIPFFFLSSVDPLAKPVLPRVLPIGHILPVHPRRPVMCRNQQRRIHLGDDHNFYIWDENHTSSDAWDFFGFKLYIIFFIYKGRESSMHRTRDADDGLGRADDRSPRRIPSRREGQQARRWCHPGIFQMLTNCSSSTIRVFILRLWARKRSILLERLQRALNISKEEDFSSSEWLQMWERSFSVVRNCVTISTLIYFPAVKQRIIWE